MGVFFLEVFIVSIHNETWKLHFKTTAASARGGWVKLRPRPNRRHSADAIFKCIFENENEWISPRISLKFVPKFRINNIPALVQIMAWRRPGDKSLSEPMMVISLPTHICATRPQWVNAYPVSNIISLVAVGCYLENVKIPPPPPPPPPLIYNMHLNLY